MLKFKIKVKHHYKKIEKLSNNLIDSVKEGLEDALNNTRGYAIRLERGHNEQGIIVDMVDVSTQKIKSRIYADPNQFMAENGMSYLWFEYFGTGTSAEMEHIGTTKHFLESGYSQWFIPIAKVGKKLGYPIITINGAQFYVAHGTKANHFLQDAEFQSRNQNKEIIVQKINEMISEVCK